VWPREAPNPNWGAGDGGDPDETTPTGRATLTPTLEERSLAVKMGIGSLDQPRDGWSFDNIIYLRGWALGPDGPVSEVRIHLGDSHIGAARLRVPRDDVARAHPAIPGSDTAGFLFCHAFPPEFTFEGQLRAIARGSADQEWPLGGADISIGLGRATVSRVNVELTNSCNLRCRWCTSRLRKAGRMSPDLFERVIREIAESPALDVRELHYYNGGESMLHPRFAAMMDTSRQVFSESARNRPKRILVTNGTKLDERGVQTLLSGGLDEVHVSIDGGTKQSYEAHRRGAKWERVLAGTNRLLDENERRKHPLRTALITIDLGVEPSSEFQELASRFDVYALRPPHNWDGSEPLDGLAPKLANLLPCWHIFNNIAVLWNGDVTACCADLIGRGVMGNLSAGSLADHWSGPHRQLRLMQCMDRKHEITLCRFCAVA